MGDVCCEHKNPELQKLANAQAKVLWIVLFINLTMFVVEIGSGLYASSVALLGDSLDMLGDALAYGVSLYVVHKGLHAKAKAAAFKGWVVLTSSITVLASAAYRTFVQDLPVAEVMGTVGLLALAANATCLLLLTRHRTADVNMQSVWICSRNDIIANVSVMGAAGAVYLVGHPWPDLVVGITLALLFTKSALNIFAESRRTLKLGT